MLNCICVGLGGFAGSVMRYLVGLIPIKTDSAFPYMTLIINALGAFLIGVFVSLFDRNKIINPHVMLLLKVGICGGFTTFSTFAYEIQDLVKGNHIGIGVLYALLSMILGVIAVTFGLYASKLLPVISK